MFVRAHAEIAAELRDGDARQLLAVDAVRQEGVRVSVKRLDVPRSGLALLPRELPTQHSHARRDVSRGPGRQRRRRKGGAKLRRELGDPSRVNLAVSRRRREDGRGWRRLRKLDGTRRHLISPDSSRDAGRGAGGHDGSQSNATTRNRSARSTARATACDGRALASRVVHTRRDHRVRPPRPITGTPAKPPKIRQANGSRCVFFPRAFLVASQARTSRAGRHLASPPPSTRPPTIPPRCTTLSTSGSSRFADQSGLYTAGFSLWSPP